MPVSAAPQTSAGKLLFEVKNGHAPMLLLAGGLPAYYGRQPVRGAAKVPLKCVQSILLRAGLNGLPSQP
jgi:hypothetical protein